MAAYDSKVSTIVAAIERAGRLDPAFGRVALDYDKLSFTVYRKGGGQSDLYAAAAALGFPVTFATSALSLSEMTQEVEGLWSRRDELATAGIEVTGVETDWPGPARVRVKELTPAASDLIKKLSPLGPEAVSVVQRDYIKMLNRGTDTSPFKGGMAIESAPGNRVDGQSTSKCSSGFTGVNGAGTRYVISAAHCVNPENGAQYVLSSRAYIGQAGTVDYGHDLSYIATPSTTPSVWDGPVLTTSTKPITGTQTPIANYGLVVSGMALGVRGYAFVSQGGHYNYRTQWTSDYGNLHDAYLWYANSQDGSAVVGGGDSGGPVYHPSGSNAIAVGVVSGGDGQVACPSGANTTVCNKTVYFSDIATEASRPERGLSLTQ